MAESSNRAKAVAEILWELKREDKLATFTTIAGRVGFAPGSGGRTVITCLKTVRRDWPQLQWWRAIADNGHVESEQQSFLNQNGYKTEEVDGAIAVKLSESETLWVGVPEEHQQVS